MLVSVRGSLLLSSCDALRATLVGTKTFGKGVVQFYFPMDDEGSGLKVTVEKYLGPDGYDISRNGGIEPDLACNDYPRGGLASASDDRCIAAALRLIRSAADAGTG
jgi:C-terminal processing protease CtpA/Prc